MNVAVLTIALLICVTGYAHGQAVTEACGASDACDADLTCEDDGSGNKKCMAKIGTTCTAESTDQCVSTAAACPSGDSPTCACAADKKPNAGKTECEARIKIDQVCSAVGADECVPGSTCKDIGSGTLNCVCSDGSTANSANDKCLMKIDQTCAVVADCVTGSTCMQTKCKCGDKKVATNDMINCRIAEGQTCTGTGTECGDHATCKNDPKTCACDTDYSAENGRCGKKVGVACGNTNECVMNAECKTNCQCKANFEVNSDKFCAAGAQAVIGSVLLLVVAMLTSRLL